MKKYTTICIIILALLTVVQGCSHIAKSNKLNNPADGFDPYYCDEDEDCYLSDYNLDKCCEATCGIFAFNVETINRTYDWREDNCDFKKETNFTDYKWVDCPQSPYYEYAECALIPNQMAAKCEQNKCKVTINKDTDSSSNITNQIKRLFHQKL
jgi:hypothetical protein